MPCMREDLTFSCKYGTLEELFTMTITRAKNPSLQQMFLCPNMLTQRMEKFPTELPKRLLMKI